MNAYIHLRRVSHTSVEARAEPGNVPKYTYSRSEQDRKCVNVHTVELDNMYAPSNGEKYGHARTRAKLEYRGHTKLWSLAKQYLATRSFLFAESMQGHVHIHDGT